MNNWNERWKNIISQLLHLEKIVSTTDFGSFTERVGFLLRVKTLQDGVTMLPKRR
jgi:hypothetical protein